VDTDGSFVGSPNASMVADDRLLDPSECGHVPGVVGGQVTTNCESFRCPQSDRSIRGFLHDCSELYTRLGMWVKSCCGTCKEMRPEGLERTLSVSSPDH
jgi:hypothetical protein